MSFHWRSAKSLNEHSPRQHIDRFVGSLVPVARSTLLAFASYSVATASAPASSTHTSFASSVPTLAATHTAPTGSITGTVWRFDHSSPVAGVSVSLLRSCNTVGHDEEGYIGRVLDRVLIPGRVDVVSTDADGRFRFDSYPNGTYCLLATWTHLLEAKVGGVVIDEQSSEHPIEIVMPPHGYLDGRVLAPDGASFDHTMLHARVVRRRPELYPLGAQLQFDPESKRTDVAADGSFHLGPLPIELFDVELIFQSPDARFTHGAIEHRHSMGREMIDVASARASREREYDAREIVPGRIRVHATLNGKPVDRLAVDVIDPAKVTLSCPGDFCDKQGDVEIYGLTPGEYRVAVRSPDNAWFYASPERATVRRAQTTSLAVDAKTIEGALLLIDSIDHERLRKQSATICLERDGLGLHANASSDADALVHINLPAGRYSIQRERTGAAEMETAVFPWPPASASPLEIDLPRERTSKR